jgi:hypothetical protein
MLQFVHIFPSNLLCLLKNLLQIANATNEVTSTKKPFINPRINPKSNNAESIMSNVFITNFKQRYYFNLLLFQ